MLRKISVVMIKQVALGLIVISPVIHTINHSHVSTTLFKMMYICYGSVSEYVRRSKAVKIAQRSAVQYSTVQYSTVQYSTVQYSTVQYSTLQ